MTPLVDFEHPGFLFIEQYPHGLPENRQDLARCVQAYIDFLLVESGQNGELPINLLAIFKRFELKLGSAELLDTLPDMQGFASSDTGIILSSDSDPFTRQRFTQAHELLEFLLAALKGNHYNSDVQRYMGGRTKEYLCNWGAGRLLMPIRSFNDRIGRMGLSIETAIRVKKEYQTSLLATLYHMVYCYPHKCGLIVWKHALSPKEVREQKAKQFQRPLFEPMHDLLPPKKLRVWWTAFGRIASHLWVPPDKSIDESSVVYRAFKGGTLEQGTEHLNLVKLVGNFHIEAIPIQWGDINGALSLIHWPESMFDGKQGELDF